MVQGVSFLITEGRLCQISSYSSTRCRHCVYLPGNIADTRCRLEPVIHTLVNLVFEYHFFIIPVMNVEVTITYVIHRVLTDIDFKSNL